MNKKDKEKDKKHSTDSGEFVPTFFTWQTLDTEKHRAKELANKTVKKKK